MGVVMLDFGKRLKKLRADLGITQEKLARDLDIPESSIRRLEVSGSVPRTARIHQIADYFGVTTDYLLFGREDKGEEELSDVDKRILIEYRKLSNDDKKYIEDLIKRIAK